MNVFKSMLFSYDKDLSIKSAFSFSDIDQLLSGEKPHNPAILDTLTNHNLIHLISEIFSKSDNKNNYDYNNDIIYRFLYGREHNEEPDLKKIEIIDAIKNLKVLMDTFRVFSLSGQNNPDIMKLNEQIIDNIMKVGHTLGLETHYLATELYLKNIQSHRKMPVASYLLDKGYLQYDSFINTEQFINFQSQNLQSNSNDELRIYLMNPLYIAAYYNDYETLEKLLNQANTHLGKHSIICNENYDFSTGYFNNFSVYDSCYKKEVVCNYDLLKEHFNFYVSQFEKKNKKIATDIIKSSQCCLHKPSLLNMDILVLLAFTFPEYDNKRNFVDADMSIKIKSLFEKNGYNFTPEKEGIILNHALNQHNVKSFAKWNWNTSQQQPLDSLISTDKFNIKLLRYNTSEFVESKQQLFTSKISEIGEYLSSLSDNQYVSKIETMLNKTNIKRLINEIQSYSHEQDLTKNFIDNNVNSLFAPLLLIREYTTDKWNKNHTQINKLITDFCKPLFDIKPKNTGQSDKTALSEKNILDLHMFLNQKLKYINNPANTETNKVKVSRI